MRRIRPEDEPAVLEIHADPESSRHHPAGPATPEQARGHLTRWMRQWEVNGIGYWTVILASTGETIGFGGLDHTATEDGRILNLYYRFRPSAWGNGYAPEMGAVAVDWARRERPDRPVVIVTRPVNVPAQRVAEKLGFVRYAERYTRGYREWLYRLPDQGWTMVT